MWALLINALDQSLANEKEKRETTDKHMKTRTEEKGTIE